MTDEINPASPYGPDGAIIYDIRMLPDKTFDVVLSHVQRQLLCFIASRGGEIDYDYELLKKEEDPEWEKADVKRFGEPIADHIRRLVTRMRLLTETPILGAHKDKVHLRLTDFGRNIVTQILKNHGIVLP